MSARRRADSGGLQWPASLRPRSWALRHAQTLLYALGQLCRAPSATAMTAAVIAIALALPAGTHTLLGSARSLGRVWDDAAGVSLYLRTDLDAGEASRLAAELGARSDVERASLITREEALAEYRSLSGFAEALDAFPDDNPLPAVIVLRPSPAHQGTVEVAALAEALQRLPEVDLAQADLKWLKRLQGVVSVLQRGVSVLAVLLGAAVVLIVLNTIRLAIENRREEIEIAKLFGATDAFIRRPFLYTGFWYGLAGGALGWLLVLACLWALEQPVTELARLYGSRFALTRPGAETLAVLLAGGPGLGVLGAWLAVRRHLRDIEPR